MPRTRPQTSGYARIAQREEEEEEDGYNSDTLNEDDPLGGTTTKPFSSSPLDYAPIQPKRRDPMRMPSGPDPLRRPRRGRTNSGVDIKAINARLERWAEEIKQRFKRRGIKGKSAEEERLEIHHSVFQAPEWARPATRQSLEAEYDDSAERLSKVEFDDIVESVRTAIELGMHPKLISQGSSGSYFARNSGGKVMGVFKPKDEEPYASKNPKWTKWIHRNLFPFAFGRACLIPNLSYVSEAAAYVLDVQLRTNIVPYTAVVSLGSKSFFYDFWDRRAFYRKGRALPEKDGSFQVFLKGYQGATEFLREHPWPDQQAMSRIVDASRNRKKRRRWADDCRPAQAPGGKEEESDETSGLTGDDGSLSTQDFWTGELQQSFREQLEKLVIIDYIMRNTDRGSDNWMIRIDRDKKKVSIVADAPKVDYKNNTQDADGSSDAYNRRNENMTASPSPEEEETITASIGAIDNSLSWPWKHPDAWRSYPFGWLFLPVNLIGRPFTEKTRHHFLPLLTSKDWWSETQVKLRATFEMDADFKEKMFARQMAVMKGQAWNVVETLKTADHGPLELARRSRVCVWDDLVDIPVAVPLKRPSEEMRRFTAQQAKQDQRKGIAEEREEEEEEPQVEGDDGQEEEMDISAARSSVPTIINTADFANPHKSSNPSSKNRPDPNPFNHSRQNSMQEVPQLLTTPTPPRISNNSNNKLPSQTTPRPKSTRTRTGGVAATASAAAARMSLDGPRSRGYSYTHSPSAERRRRFSFSVGRRRSHHFFSDDNDEEEDDGDLGYAAASDLQHVTRKVIVERLEMVKSKPPVFSWC